MMQAREYLEQVGNLNMRITVKLKKVQSLRDSLSIGSAPTDTDHVPHTRNTDVMGRRIAAVVDAEREVDILINELVDLKVQISAMLDQMEDLQEVLFLTERYLNLKQQVNIAEEYHVSPRWVREVCTQGLDHFQQILDSTVP